MPEALGMQLFLPGALDLADAARVWIPQAPGVSFSPLVLSTSQGYYVNLLRVQRSGVLSRHRHVGPVHAFTLEGSWRYLEHPWTARSGDYVYEPPGEIHTLVVPEGVTRMVTLFHVTGGYTYLDAEGRITGFEDVFSKLEAVRLHLRSLNEPETAVEKLIR